jgi:hypothetical protein
MRTGVFMVDPGSTSDLTIHRLIRIQGYCFLRISLLDMEDRTGRIPVGITSDHHSAIPGDAYHLANRAHWVRNMHQHEQPCPTAEIHHMTWLLNPSDPLYQKLQVVIVMKKNA